MGSTIMVQLAVVLLVAAAANAGAGMAAASKGGGAIVPALIVFGDSIVDPGNNNGLDTMIKCNFPPYGMDFVDHRATGRFSNGLVPSDLIASIVGVKELLPPYLWVELSPEDILTGVSFASGASGYDPETSKLVNVISMTAQLDLFAEYKGKLKDVAGESRAAEIVDEALYIICAGTDDIANTYFTFPFRRLHYDLPSFVSFIVSQATDFIRKLRDMGARKIGYVGLPPIGCVPSQRTLAGGLARDCDPERNEAAQMFNSEIAAAIAGLAEEPAFAGSKVVYLDIYDVLNDLIQRPEEYGFEESTKGCCGTGEIEVTMLCNSKTATTCDDVSKYVFWDSFHPTERAYRIMVNKLNSTYLPMIF